MPQLLRVRQRIPRPLRHLGPDKKSKFRCGDICAISPHVVYAPGHPVHVGVDAQPAHDGALAHLLGIKTCVGSCFKSSTLTLKNNGNHIIFYRRSYLDPLSAAAAAATGESGEPFSRPACKRCSLVANRTKLAQKSIRDRNSPLPFFNGLITSGAPTDARNYFRTFRRAVPAALYKLYGKNICKV